MNFSFLNPISKGLFIRLHPEIFSFKIYQIHVLYSFTYIGKIILNSEMNTPLLYSTLPNIFKRHTKSHAGNPVTWNMCFNIFFTNTEP